MRVAAVPARRSRSGGGGGWGGVENQASLGHNHLGVRKVGVGVREGWTQEDVGVVPVGRGGVWTKWGENENAGGKAWVVRGERGGGFDPTPRPSLGFHLVHPGAHTAKNGSSLREICTFHLIEIRGGSDFSAEGGCAQGVAYKKNMRTHKNTHGKAALKYVRRRQQHSQHTKFFTGGSDFRPNLPPRHTLIINPL